MTTPSPNAAEAGEAALDAYSRVVVSVAEELLR